MNKKDIIIVAALLNAATLAILFMMAVNVDEEGLMHSSEVLIEASAAQAATSLIENNTSWAMNDGKAYSMDEVDDILRDFEALASAEIVPADEIAFEPVSESFVSNQPLTPRDNQPVTVSTSAKFSHIVEIIVKKGDSLERIAKANGSSVLDIKQVNQLKTERLAIGQVLKVPVGSAKKEEPEILPPKPGDPEYYVVKSGDSPWKIAKNMGIKMEDLLELNNLNEEKARNLKIGDKIRIR